MPYRVLELELTDEQIAQIQAIVDDDNRPFGLLAQPQVRGAFSGSMNVYICTKEQYEILDPAIKSARQLPSF